MTNTVIQARDIKKRYNLGSITTQTFFSDLLGYVGVGAKKHRTEVVDDDDQYWALKGVSFDIQKGEVFGIIGRNGAGKSTLLKILSRVTAPTTGSVKIKGRVASLLEVGTGFHPDLSGKDNVYLNGAILGMKKAEIDRKFDEIVAFSGIGTYINTPVKRYSSGMYVRLAFAVAAHLEPEVLIIDEVLAVGDVEFQKKCLGKMKDVSEGGRTVLFVSHNMNAVNSLCNRSLLLNKGKIEMLDETGEVIKHYLSSFASFNYKIVPTEYIGDEYVSLVGARLVRPDMKDAEMIIVTEKFGIEIKYRIHKRGYKPGPNFLLSTQDGEKVFQSLMPGIESYQEPGVYTSVAWFYPNLLNDIGYKLTIAATTHNPTKIHFSADINFQLYDDINAPTRGDYKGQMHGLMRPMLDWEIYNKD
jgi:lipopolysaccharide transport system ATP-binding protein